MNEHVKLCKQCFLQLKIETVCFVCFTWYLKSPRTGCANKMISYHVTEKEMTSSLGETVHFKGYSIIKL